MVRFTFGPDGEHAGHGAFYKIDGIEAWREELALRSRLTANDYARRLALFCSVTSLSPATIVKNAKEAPEQFRALLAAYAAAQQGRGRKAVYVRKHLDAIRSWLDRNGVRNLAVPKLSGRRGETIEGERTPTQDELRELLGALSPRGRMVALLMAHAGLRPGAIANIDATGGLVLADLPELEVSPEPAFRRVPFEVHVRSVQSKNAKSYLTFGSRELAEAVVVYLRDRISRGERLLPNSPLVASLGAGTGEGGTGAKGAGEFVSTKSITLDLREAIQRVRPGGQTFRPYCLRAYFSTQLLIAESKGLIIRDAREAFLGHDLGVAGRYNLGKKLGDHVVDELRGMYERSLPYLTATPSPATSNEEVYRIILEMAGLDSDEVGKLGPLDSVVVLTALRRAKAASAGADVPATPGQQKVVDATAAEAWIEKGWRFVAPLNGAKVVVEAPSE